MRIATPSAVPIWRAVLLRPEASPASSSAMPASAATVAVTKDSPIPRPHSEQPEEDVPEVAAVDRQLRQHEGAHADQPQARRGDGAEAGLDDDALTDQRADGCPRREHDRADPEPQRRVAEHLLRVQGEDERHADRDGADQEHQAVRGDERARVEDASGTQRRAVARLDQRERGQQHRGAGEREDRPRVAPADLRCLDRRVDEQHEGAGDGQRSGGVVAARRPRGLALAQEPRRQRQRGHTERDVDEEDPLPAGAVDERAADQPRGGGTDAAERAPDPERPVPLGARR